MKTLLCVLLLCLLCAAPAAAVAPLTLDAAGPVFLTSGGVIGGLVTVGVPMLADVPVLKEVDSVLDLGFVVSGTSVGSITVNPAITTTIQFGTQPAAKVGLAWTPTMTKPVSWVVGVDLWRDLSSSGATSLSLGMPPSPVAADAGAGIWAARTWPL